MCCSVKCSLPHLLLWNWGLGLVVVHRIVDFIKKETKVDYLASADESGEPNPFAQPYRGQAACACALQ